MQLLDLGVHQSVSTQAERTSAKNWEVNLRALRQTQPGLADTIQSDPSPNVSWVYARDGFLTCKTRDSRWFAHCSVPHKSAEMLLQTLDTSVPVACFLTPTHPAQLRVALDRLNRSQAIIALIPDASIIRIFLSCDDFSNDINLHRLWFAVGPDWSGEMKKLFVDHPGLPTPSQFIKTRLADESTIENIINSSEKNLSRTIAERAESINKIASGKAANPEKICLLAGSEYRLWDHAAGVLADVLSPVSGNLNHVDPDDPISASPLHLAQAASDCGAIVAANLGRSDVPKVVADRTPWITWITAPRVPAFCVDSPNDLILVADANWRTIAKQSGWNDTSIHIATWPTMQLASKQTEPSIAFIADTQPVTQPKKLADYSSHTLLWEMIEAELSADPFCLTGDVQQYLAHRCKRMNITDTAFDSQSFINKLIMPLYQQGLARTLISAGVAVKLFGKGWAQIADLAMHHAGEISNFNQLQNVASIATALVYPWPMNCAHPIDALGKPVIRPDRGKESFIRAAKSAISRSAPSPKSPAQKLTLDLLRKFMPALLAAR